MTAGLVAAWAWPGSYGRDLVGFTHLQANGAVAYDGALGLVCNATGANYSITTPSYLRLQMPLSIVLKGVQIGAPSVNYYVFGAAYDTAQSNPFTSYMIGVDSTSSRYRLDWNNGTFLFLTDSTHAIASNDPVWIGAVMRSGFQQIYVNSVPTASASGNGTGTIGYGADSPFMIGNYYSGVNMSFAYEYALVYNRFLSEPELLWLLNKGNDLFARPRGWAGWVAATEAGSGAAAAIPPHLFFNRAV